MSSDPDGLFPGDEDTDDAGDDAIPPPGPPDTIAKILRSDATHPRGAYEFVEEALRLAHRRANERRHVTAAELLDAFRFLALRSFGPLARTVLAEWNVRTTADVGRIVFRMVEAGEMGRTDEDDEKDFDGVFEFESAFPDETGPVAFPPKSEDDSDDADS